MSDERPIPLLFVNDEGKFSLGEEAIKVVSKIKGKIGVIAIAGLYRYVKLIIYQFKIKNWKILHFKSIVG